MTNYQLSNTSDKAIGLTIVRKVLDGTKESTIKEDIVLYPNTVLDLPKLAGSHIDFHSNVDFTFRQKKAVSEKFNIINKVVKEVQSNVSSVDLPAHFVMLKIKKVHT